MKNTLRAAAISAAMLATSSALADPAGVRLVQVEPTSAAAIRRVAGTILAAQRATIATRIPASVIEVRVREGDRVMRGQILVRLSDEDVRGALAAAQTALEVARAQEKRIRSLLQQQAATQVELDQAVAQRAQAEAAISAARANLAYAELRAPFAGIVQAKRVNAGDLVGPGQPLLDVEGSGGLEVQATVGEREATGLRTGMRLGFASGAARGLAEITALAPGGDPVSHRVALRARVIEGAERLRSGTFVRLELPSSAGAAEAVWIPRSAVVERGDLTGVFVADGERARLRWLSVGEVDGDLVAVRAGLKPGETIVDAPGAMRDGAPIGAAAGAR